MVNRLAATLYFLTALATLNAGLVSFNFLYSVISPINHRWLASYVILVFAAPTVFLLAGISAFGTNNKSMASRWITAAALLIVLMLICAHYGLGWRLFSKATGALLSIVFILGSSVRQASTIAGIGTVVYAVLQGPDLISNLQMYWAFGGSRQHLLATIMTPILVTASLVMAVLSHVKTRATISRFHLDG
jgi:hypothetical protein